MDILTIKVEAVEASDVASNNNEDRSGQQTKQVGVSGKVCSTLFKCWVGFVVYVVVVVVCCGCWCICSCCYINFIFGMAAMPFSCNGILLIHCNEMS